MANNLEILYNSLKRDNYDVPATYESFARTLTASGMEGVRNRQALYNSLRNDDYDVPDTYESFATTLFVPDMSRQNGNGISEAQSQRTGSGRKSTFRGDLVQTTSTSRGEADPTVATSPRDAVQTVSTSRRDAAPVGNVAPEEHVMTPSERLRVARHELEAAQSAVARKEEERKARQAEKDYYKAVREEEEQIREHNAEGRARADAEGIDWNAVPDEGETGVRYDDLLSEQAQVKRLANTAGYLGPHLDKEGARAVSSDIGEGVYYHRDGRTSQEREPFAARARAMNDPEDIYRTPTGSGIDPRGASADPIALPELEVTGSSRSSIMKRVDEMRFLDESLKDVGDVELRKRASMELQSERDEVDARLGKWKEENPDKWRDMSREDRAELKAGFADDVNFERFMSGIDARIAANEREQQRRMSEIERQVREDLSKTPEGRRLLKEPDSDMDIRRRVELAAGYDSEIRALRQESWNLGEMRNAKLAAESDGGRESLWNFAKGVGRGLREIVENPLGLRSMHNDATQLMRVFGKLQEGEALTDTEQRAVESHFTRQMDDTHYDMSQSAKAGEFTAALAEIAVEFGLNPASGAVRRVLTGIAREVGPAAVRATVMNAPALLYKLGVSSTEIGARAFAGNIAKVIGAAIGEGAGATFSTQLAKNLEESVSRAISMPVYDAKGNLAGLAGDSFGSAAAKTFTTSAGTNAVFMLPAHFGGEAMKGLGRFAEYVDQRGMGIPFGNPVDALVKMKSGEIIGVIASDIYGRSLGDPTMGDVFSEESAKEMIIGLLAAEFTTGGMKFAGRQIKGSTLDMAIIKNEAEVRRAAAKMAASLKNQDGAVDAEGLRILEMVMGADASMDPGVIGNCLKALAESSAPQETRQAALDYLRASYRWRGSVARREQWRESGKEQDWRDDPDVSTSRRDAAPGKEAAPDGDRTRNERTLVSPEEIEREKARQRADEALRGGYEAVDPEIRAEMQRNAESAVAGIYDRFEHPEDVMEILDGIEDAEGLIKEVHENEHMDAPQKEAAEAYVLSSMAERGMSMRREDDRVKAREDIREDVGRMSTPDGMLRPVTLKRDDRQVMVLSGEIVLSDDGSTVLPSESSSVLWIYDPATGGPRAAAPEEILNVGPVMTAEAEIERRIKELEAIEAQAESQEVMSEPSVSASQRDAAPDVSPSRREADPDVAGAEERDKADAVYERALAAREGLEDAFSDNPEFWLNEVHENPEAVLSDPEIPDFQKNAVREYLEAMKALEEADGKETNSKTETPSVPGMPENVPNSTENIVSEGEITPEAVSNVENGEQTALSRIPTNEQGEPKFEAVDKDTAWDGLVEAVGGEADAADIAMAQIQQASAELEALKKKPPTLKVPKLQGSPMAMAQAKRKANEQYQRELSQYDQQIAEAQTRLDAWNGIIGVYKSRNAPRNHEQPVKRETIQRESADDRSMENFFGPVYTEFQGNGNKAEAYLREKCEGVAKGALTYPGIAPIDLAWGDMKAGYMKIVIKHPEVVGKLQELLDQCMITNRSDNRIVLESDTHKFVVSKMKGSTPTDNWLLTTYQKKEKPASASSSDIETEPGGKRNGTATPQNGLYGKVNALSADKQVDSAESSGESPSRRDAAPNSTSGKDAARLGGETSGNLSKKEVVSSEENDENGRPFVLADDGTTSFGHIDEESGLTAAPIKLSEGFQDEVTGHGYGLIHIEAGHGEQIRTAGFKSVKDFVSFVAKNYDRDNIRVGKRRPNGSGTFLIQVTDRHDNTLFIELSKDGSYWNVNSGGIFRKGYSNKKETVAETEPQQPDNAVSGGSSLSKGSQTGISPSEPNGKPTVSTGKVNTLSVDKQADSAESSGESPSRREAAPDVLPSRKRSNTGVDKEIRAAAEEMRDCPEALEILTNMDPQDIYEAASVVLATNRVLLSDAQGAIGAKREMGLGRIEQKKYFGLFASAEKGGKSIQKLSEDAMQELCAQYGIPYDNMDARNALLEILQSHSTRGEIGNYIRNRRLEQARKIHRDWENMLEDEEERAAWEAYGMTLADLDAYNEMRDADAKEHLQDLDEREYNATFADIYAQREEEYDRRAKESVRSGDGRGIREIAGYESSGERPLSGRGDEVLSGEKSYKASGIEADERSGVQSGDGTEGAVETDGVSAGASGIANKITEAERLVNTEPTEAQKKAGNYRMGHVWVDGHNITIENPKGSVRRGVDAEGKPWETRMNNTYGYICGTQSVDGDHIDVFLSDAPERGDVFVVDQVDKDGNFDEHKVMYGFPSGQAARKAYLSNYKPGWTGLGAITHVSKDEFKKWIGSSKRKTKPFAKYKSVKIYKEQNPQLAIEPDGFSDFGPVFTQFKGNAQGAIKVLSELQDGEAIGALHHKDIGDIDLVWGNAGTAKSDGFGLAKLVKFHPEVVEHLQEILDDMHIVTRSDNRINLESDTHKAAVRLTWDKEKKKWLLTAFEKKETPKSIDKTTDTGDNPTDLRGGTALSQNSGVSAGKDNALSADKQADSVKSSGESPSRRDAAPKGNTMPDVQLEDFGEKIAGARKDLLKDIAKSIETVTVQSLIELPLAKAFKRPNLKKMVESGTISNEDAALAEAVMLGLVYAKKKPAISRSPRRKREIEEWSRETYDGIRLLGEVLSGDPARRDRAMELRDQKLAERLAEENRHIDKLREWNPGKEFPYLTALPDEVDVLRRVLEGINHQAGDKINLPLTRINLGPTRKTYVTESSGKQGSFWFKHSHDSLEEAVETMIFAAKLARGDEDVEIPARHFVTRGIGQPHSEPTGKHVVVYWAKDGKTLNEKVFKDKTEAETFAAENNGRVRKQVRYLNEYDNYVAVVVNPLTGTKHEIGKEYPDRSTLAVWMDESHDELNRLAVEAIQNEMGNKKSKQNHFYVTSTRINGKVVHSVVANDKRNPWPILKDFATRKEAEDWLESNRAELEDSRQKRIDTERSVVYFNTGEQREGKDWRKGNPATPEMYDEQFGFRGVQFGNWTNNNDRQAAMNQAYDALMDLSEQLGLSPRAMSLHGELGLAFGARGGGNAGAHYEPVEVVINLTKTKGSGSLAHEWWHALDNYLSRKAGVALGLATSGHGRENMDPTVAAAIDALMQAVRTSDYGQRGMMKGDYWGRPTELVARLFESWVSERIKSRKELSPFLASGLNENALRLYQQLNYLYYRADEHRKADSEQRAPQVMSKEEFFKTTASLNGYPYPTKEEIAEFSPYIEDLFVRLKNKEALDGMMAQEPRRGYGRRRSVNTGINLFDWADKEDRKNNRTERDEEIAAAEEADSAIDTYADVYDEYLRESQRFENELATQGHDEESRKEIEESIGYQESRVIETRDWLEDNLKQFYVRNNTPEDAKRLAHDMVVRVQAEVEYRRNTGWMLKEILSNKEDVTPPPIEEMRESPVPDIVKTAGGERIETEGHGGLRRLGEGEFSLVERKFSTTGEFSFTTDGRIESMDDVAYIFRSLENYSVEHTFALLVKEGKPLIVHLGMGGPTASMADLTAIRAAYDAHGADSAWFVHNHPSGVMRPSPQDISLLKEVEKIFPAGVMQDGLIIDVTSGRYCTFDSSAGEVGKGEARHPEGAERPVEVKQFDRSAFKEGFDPEKLSQVTSSEAAARYISTERLGERAKTGVLLLNNQNKVVGNLYSRETDLKTYEARKRLVEEIAQLGTKYGARNVIIYGNSGIGALDKVMNLSEKISGISGGIRLLDVIQITNGLDSGTDVAYRSANDGTLRAAEPEVKSHREDSAMTGGEDRRYRDGHELSDGERLRAIRDLEPIEVERNDMSRAELREVYNNLPSVEKDGREIEFYRSAFKKIYKDGGLFGQVVPVLDEILEQSVLAYSEEDNLGGMTRPDGTIHKEHPNTLSFDNYVGKVDIDGIGHYVRITIQHDKGNRNGMHSCFVTEVEIYENAELQATGTENSRVKPYNSGIVDAKLQQFFERASAEADKLDMRDRAVELSEKLNTPIRIVTDEAELSELSEDGKPRYSRRERRAKGWWDGQTGEIVIVLPNNRDVADVDNTVVHEVVGHKGLRALIGEERFDEFLGEVYDHASNPIRKVIDKMTDDIVNAEADRLRVRKAQAHERAGEDVNANYYTDMAEARVEADAKRGDFRKEATEEYMADLGGRIGSEGFAQMSRDELSFWGKIKAKVQSFLDKFLRGLKIAKSIQLTDKDLSYILYKSWKNMRDGKSSLRSDHNTGGVFAEAEDVAMRMRTGWGMDPLRSMTEAEKRERRKEKTADRIEELFDQAVKGDLTGKPVEVGKLTPEGKEYLEKLSGVKLKDEVSFVLNPSDLAHINRRHFGDNETDARNIPLTKEDIRSIGEILNAPDRIVYGKETVGNQRSMFFFLKETEDGSYNLMEVYSDRKGNLTAKSFFKSKEGVSQRAMLLNESSTLTSVTDGATLLSDANLPKFFEYPKSGDEDGIMRFRDPDMGLEETITKMKTEAMLANADNLKTKHDAMRAIGGNLSHLRQAMTRQKDYDISTVNSVTDLARILMDAGLLDGISKYETKRILSAIDNVVGKQDVSRYVQRVMDIMVGNQLRNRADAFGKLLSVRGSRVDARGIEVQGILDPDGQRIAQVVRKSTTLPKDDIDNRIAEAINRMSSTDQAIADEATLEYAGLQISRQYVEDITESKAEEKTLRDSIREAKEAKDAGQMTEDAYRQYVESTENAIRQNKIERAEAYQSLLEHMGGMLSESVKRAKAWREAEKERVNKIHHYANSDMEGRPTDEHHKDDRVQKLANNSGVRFLLAPLATFDQMLRMFGKKNTRGEGYLWNHYMRGWVNATEKEYTGYRDALKALDAKVKEVFGKSSLRSDHDGKQGAGYDKGVKVKCWGDLFTLDRKLPKGTVRFFDGGDMKDHELTQGNLLYIYMADKMSDGRMKLRYMGITEDDVKEIKNLLDPRFIELADWMQEEFLVDKRNEYNEVHKRMFGTSMAAIENYFPLKILANARLENVDVAEDTTDTALPATSTGSIIKRRRNNLALDVTGANAFSVILDHLQQMERWAAFAEFNRDLNTLLSYKRFRNQVMNMSSAYGGGKTLWNNFRNVCSMAAGAYRPPIAALDKAAVNVAKGVTAAKVSFRMFTALKQFLSMPAYVSDSNPAYLGANIANPFKAWEWSMENLPLFEKRWKSRMAGDPRLLKSEMDWKMWRNRIVEIASRVGMSPNAFVDALTVSIGARSMYQTKLAKYKRMGYGENEADKRAKQDATILFNQTQQSSESAFLSTMQVDRSWLSVLFTVFRNSSMSYTRQLYDSIRNLGRRLSPGYKGLSEEFMTKQMVRDGIDPEKASENARREYRRGIIRDFVRVGIFGYGLQLAWNLGAYLPYLILGEDDEEKDNMWQDVWNHTMFGSVEGLTGGDVMSAAGNMWVSGEGNPQYLTKDMPLASDVLSILKKMDKDQVSAMNDVINLLAQSTVGVNPQSLTDGVVAVMDYCGDNAETSRECALLIARILNCPPSQLDKIYFDELGADGREAAGMTPAEIAERYAEYKIMKEAPVTGWMRSDAERDSLSAKKQKRALAEAKSRIGKRLATEETRRLLLEYDSVTKRESEINKMRAEDKEAYRKARTELRESTDMRRHARLRRYKHDMKELTQKYLRTKDRKELEELVRLMTATRDKMLEDISEIEYKRKGA